MKKGFLILLFAAALAPVCVAQEGLTTLAERYSYAMGVRLGEALKRQGAGEIDQRAMAAAIEDVMKERALRMDDEEIRAAVLEHRAMRNQGNLQAGQDFLARNAGKPGVTVLPNGLQYRVLKQGSGQQPGAQDTVSVHYHGTKIDGDVFDSSVDRDQPAEFPLAGVIPGFREAITRMQVGDHWQVFVPSELAYGESGAGGKIGPNEALIFEIQLLDILR